jgi:hypothetical protein
MSKDWKKGADGYPRDLAELRLTLYFKHKHKHDNSASGKVSMSTTQHRPFYKNAHLTLYSGYYDIEVLWTKKRRGRLSVFSRPPYIFPLQAPAAKSRRSATMVIQRSSRSPLHWTFPSISTLVPTSAYRYSTMDNAGSCQSSKHRQNW